MTAQAAIGNPRVFVDHIPTLQERYDVIIQHLQLAIAYEIRFQQILEQYPHNPDNPILQANKLVLHYKKKMDDDDTLVHTQKETHRHDYMLPFPQLQDIQTMANTIQADDTHPYRAIVEFRKYLFNYIKGIPGSKECKQEIAKTQNYQELYNLMTDFFHTAQNTSI
jgi:tRNA-dihydrouridine synthase